MSRGVALATIPAGGLSVEKARAWLAKARDVDEVRDLRDKASAIAAYERKRDAGKASGVDADVVVVLAERRIGELLKELPKATKAEAGARAGGPGKKGASPSAGPAAPKKSATLSAHGIAKQDAARYEAASRIPEKEFLATVRAEAAKGKRITTRRIIEPIRRAERDKKLAAQATPIVGVRGRLCSVLLADPPWRYEHRKEDDPRAIEKEYPTLTLEEICGTPAGNLCTPDAMLFMWATSPKLAESFQVLEAWGFTYRTCMVWVKDKIGMGYFVRQRHELLLIAMRGSVAVPAGADRPDSVIEAPRGRHSEKPECVYPMIERMYPNLPKGEIFARQLHDGWLSWGNEVPSVA